MCHRALTSDLLPSTKWALTSELCRNEGQQGIHQGFVVFTQTEHQLVPVGRVTRFASMLGAPSHLRADMLFLRRDSEAQDGVKVTNPSLLLYLEPAK
jgi:hypothetical protein